MCAAVFSSNTRVHVNPEGPWQVVAHCLDQLLIPPGLPGVASHSDFITHPHRDGKREGPSSNRITVPSLQQ